MKKSDEIRAGVFILIGLIITAAAIFVLGQEREIFSDQEEFLTTFSDVKGLSEGAPVRLGGITVGRVSEIGFSKDPSDIRVHVKLLVNVDYLDRLRSDSAISIETQGLLGDRFLTITPGTDKNLIAPGSEVKSSEAPDLAQVLSKAGEVVDNTVKISRNVNDFIDTLKKDSLDDISRAANSLANLSDQIEKGDGLLHRLIYSKKDGEIIMKGVSEATEALGDISTQIQSGKGFLHSLIYDPAGSELVTALADASKNIAITSASVSDLADKIRNGSGLIHHLVYGESPQGLAEVMKIIVESAENLKRVTEAMAQGSGSLGALLVDPQLYDNLVEVTDGAKRSIILRQVIRSSLDR